MVPSLFMVIDFSYRIHLQIPFFSQINRENHFKYCFEFIEFGYLIFHITNTFFLSWLYIWDSTNIPKKSTLNSFFDFLLSVFLNKYSVQHFHFYLFIIIFIISKWRSLSWRYTSWRSHSCHNLYISRNIMTSQWVTMLLGEPIMTSQVRFICAYTMMPQYMILRASFIMYYYI